MRTLVLGGARSGKSAHAEKVAAARPPVRYLATGVVDSADVDFAERVERHRGRRPVDWTTIDTSHDEVPTLLAESWPGATLVDDVGSWLVGCFDAHNAWSQPRGHLDGVAAQLAEAVRHSPGRLILVSPEVGLGVIPATSSGRLFRDELGSLNQRLAAICDEVVLVVAGLPVRVK